ncbi:MAG TPA: response regulator [Candidatus Krumholzibacteria bacterium]|nr:response regulator [Candidatus Krumholzibacteria bacterium]
MDGSERPDGAPRPALSPRVLLDIEQLLLTALEQLHLLESDLDTGRDPRARVIAAGAALDRAREFCRTSAAAPSPVAVGTVLLVDADPDHRLDVERRLRELGYRVHAATNAEAALVDFQALRGRVDLVVVDADLPGLGGALVSGRMRELNPHVPVEVVAKPLGREALGRLLERLERDDGAGKASE